jgi:F-type H+-transporting ATPase subunit delta
MAKLLPAQYAKILHELLADLPAEQYDAAMAAFVQMLAQDGMIKKAPYIIEAYESYAKAQAGVVMLDVTTAHPLSDELRKNISAAFDGAASVEMHEHVDPSLVGGIKIKHGNTVLDGTIKTQLAQLRRALVS